MTAVRQDAQGDQEAASSRQAPSDRREESQAERDDRNLGELLQELRVAGLGVQVLFGFLLALPFTNKFADLHGLQRGLYVADLAISAVATALLLAPVAFHRLVFRRHQKERLVQWANRMAISGLVAVALAISGAVLLIVSYVNPGLAGTAAILLSLALFAILWFALPLNVLRQAERGAATEKSTARDDDWQASELAKGERQ
jgi:Family of unknown function (DUF6328)